MERVKAGPVSADILTESEALAKAENLIRSGRPSRILTLNALMFREALNNRGFADSAAGSDLIIADSVGIAWAVRFLSGRRTARIPGIDFLHKLCALAAGKGYGVYLLGAKPGVALKAAERLRELFPGLVISGARDGYFSKEEEASVIKAVRDSGAKILFAGLAVPGQDIWLAENLESLGPLSAMGVGGSFDVISGSLKRAPLWMRRTGTEWLFRLIQQPWRIKRILELPLFVLEVLRIKTSGTGKK